MYPKILFTIVLTFFLLNTQAKVILYKAPSNSHLSSDYNIKVNGTSLDIYSSTTRYGSSASFAYFDFSDSVFLEIKTNHPAPHTTEWSILPNSLNINAKQVSNGEISFWLKKASMLSFVVCGDYWGRTLHLYADTIETNIPKPEEPGLIYFGPGFHEINSNNTHTLTIESHQKVYIAGGAVVKGFIQAKNAEDISIYGRGILMQTPDMISQRGIDIEACSNINIQGIILNRNRPGWTGFIYKSDHILIDGIKVISPAIWSTDGMNLANCSKANIRNSFFRAGDDNIAIKGLGNNRNHSSSTINPQSALPNEDITVENCSFWSDNNNAVVLGQETMAEYYRNITFRNCDVIFVRDEEPTKAALSIISLQGTEISNILFENIRVGTSGQLITLINTEEIFRIKGSQKWPGSIHDITFRNITTHERGSKNIRIEGWNTEKHIYNITMENIIVDNDTINSKSHLLKCNAYTHSIFINNDTIKKPIFKDPSSHSN